MKHFDKFKDQIRKEKLDLPDDFGWEEMNKGIFDKMDEGLNSKPHSKVTLIKGFISGFAVMFFILSISFYYSKKVDLSESKILNQSSENTEDLHSVALNSKNRTEKNVIEAMSSEKLSEDTLVLSTSTKAISKTINPSITSAQSGINTLPIENKTNPANESKSTFEKHNINESLAGSQLDKKVNTILTSKATDSNIHESMDLEAHGIKTKPSKKNKVILGSDEKRKFESETNGSNFQTEEYLNNSLETNVLNDFDSRTLSQIKFLPGLKINIEPSENFAIDEDLKMYNAPSKTTLKQSLWSLELGTGWNSWSYGVNTTSNESNIYKDHSSEYGFSFSARIERKIGNRMSIISGIGFDMIYKELNKKYTLLNEREVKDVLLSYHVNNISGHTVNTFGDTIVIDTILRSLTDYNRYRVVSIPFIVNYNILNTSSWNLDIGVGPSISLLTNYSGKYIEDNELKSFDKTSNYYSTSPNLAINASLRLRRMFSGNYYLGARIDYKNHLSNWALQSDADTKPKIISGSIILGKSF